MYEVYQDHPKQAKLNVRVVLAIAFLICAIGTGIFLITRLVSKPLTKEEARAKAGIVYIAKRSRAVPRRSAKSAAHNGKKNRRVSRRRRKRRRRNPPVSKNSGPSSATPLRRRYCSQKPSSNGSIFTKRRLPESRPPMQAIWILTESTLPKPLETCRSTRSPRTPYRTIIKESRKTAAVWMGGKAACPQRPFRTSICC